MFKKLHKILAQISALMSFVPRVNYVPGTPSSLSGLNATALRRIAWEKKLREDSVLPSVFTQIQSAINILNNRVQVVKAGIFMKVDVAPGEGQSVRLALEKPLNKAPQMGTGEQMLGNEDETDLVWVELYYNEIKKAVKFKKWGYDYNDTAYLNYTERQTQRLSRFYAELRDTRIHQALTVTYSEELTKAPVSIAQQFNKNWIIPNLDDGDFPAWDKDSLTVTPGSVDSLGYYSSKTYSGAATFVENIAASLLAASGTGSAANALLNIDAIKMVEWYATDKLLLEPVMLDGMPSYVFLISSRVAAYFTNPNKSGSMGTYFASVAEYRDPDRQSLIGELGRAGKLVFCVNHRAPTLTVTGGVGTYALQVGYQQPGNNDDRNNNPWANTSGAKNYVFDLNYVLGANALAEYMVDPLVTNLFESTEYGQIQGNGAYLGEGIQIPAFDKDAAGQADGASTTQIQRGSAIVPTSRIPIQTIS